jgi:N-acetylglutamate synthase-like GNAT family acetyltransferase
MISPLIRNAKSEDCARLAELCTQLGYPSVETDLARRLPEVLKRPMEAVFVAEMERGVVGWVHVRVSPNLEVDRMAEIAGLVVDDKLRGKGIGRALMDQAEEWARRMDCSELWLRSNVIRKGAHRFYEVLGYTNFKTSYTFLKKL